MFRNRTFVGSQISNWHGNYPILRTATPDIIRTELVGYYNTSISSSYSGSGNTLYDISGQSGPSMTLSGVSYSSVYSGILTFASSTSSITSPSSSIFNFGKTNITVQFWQYWDTAMDSTNTYYSSMSISGNHLYQGVWRSGLYPGKLYNTINNSAGFGTTGGTDPAGYVGQDYKLSGRWTNITYVKDNANAYFYINGSLSAQRSISIPTSSSQSITIGYDGVNSSYIGSFGTLLVYNKSLSAEEVLTNYNYTKNRFI